VNTVKKTTIVAVMVSLILSQAIVWMLSGTADASGLATAPLDKAGLCHATGSASEPYVYIVVRQEAVQGHLDHGDYPANSPAACQRTPMPTPTNTPLPTNTPTNTPVPPTDTPTNTPTNTLQPPRFTPPVTPTRI
jgi:hypothetical protein